MHHGSISTNIAKGLKELRKRIKTAKIPSSSLDETLNLATWNIRDFGKKARKKAAIHLIAEIMGQFDLISVVEVRDNVKDLKRVMDILGPYWHAVFSDYNLDRAGNRERIAYVYDKRAVTFTGLAAEADPIRKKKKIVIDGEEVEFSPGFTDLHTISYRELLSGRGYGLRDARPSIELCSAIRLSEPAKPRGEFHPFLNKLG